MRNIPAPPRQSAALQPPPRVPMFEGSLVALVTPMFEDGSLDLASWDQLMDLHLRSGTAGVVVGGSTGESVTLAEVEQDALLARARRKAGGRMAVIAGIGGSSTTGVVARAHQLGATSADALLLVTPAYSRPTQEGLYRHLHAVADAARVPVLLYNVPSRTGVDLLPATVARLASHARIVGIKEAAGDPGRIRALLAELPRDFAVLSGDDATSCSAVLAGAHGVISVTANLLPAALAAVMDAARRGDAVTAQGLDAHLQPLHRALGLEPNPIPVKWAMAEAGLINAGIRMPLTWLSAAAQPELRSAWQGATAALGAITTEARRA
jgi:4-hydroxy-tetrahydrodipicolinate synthase